ncbi:MAG: transcriptional regulator [Acidobacteriota bacterium]|nr:transcriptional regulator [Acidobacteriota bacterium]
MRSYGQLCALAKALDLVGDRWTLLIVRELLIRETCRYTDLRSGLPGIATNLLAERLDELVEAGLVSREAAPPPIATTVYRLTDRGRQLEPVVEALGRWGAPLLATATGKEAFLSHWLALPARLYVRDTTPKAPSVRVELRPGGEPITLETVGDGSVRTRIGATGHADATLEGPPQVVLHLLTRKVTLSAARKRGVRLHGDPKVLRRFGPKPAAQAPA